MKRSSFWFGLGTILSRVTGLIREAVVAGAFGASLVMDAFWIAFRIPNLFRDMLAEGALSGAMTKVYTSLYTEDPERARQLLSDAFKLFTLIGLSFCALGVVLAPYLVSVMTVMAPETPESESLRAHADFLTRLVFPYLLFPILGSVLMGVLHKHNRFFISAISPVGMNLGFIFGALLLAPMFDAIRPTSLSIKEIDPAIVGLTLGVLLGGLLQFIVQFLGVLKDHSWKVMVGRIHFRVSKDLTKVLVLMWPAAIAASAAPINAFVNTNFATSVGEGAVTWLHFAFRLIHLPVGVFGVAVAMAALPALATAITKAGKMVDQKASTELQQALQLVMWLLVPSSILFMCNSVELIQLFFQHNRFTAADALATGAALQAYAAGILAYGLIKVFTSFYFAVERTKYAMRVSLIGIFINLLANYFLVDRFGHVGLALTASITLTFNAGLLWLGTRKHNIMWNKPVFFKNALGIVAGITLALIAQLVIVVGLANLEWFLSLPVKATALITLTLNGLAVLFIFGAANWIIVGSLAWKRLLKR